LIKGRDNNPLVSIVMPVYNGAETIEESLNSVLKQSYRNYEIIVVDDGSTDCTVELLGKYKNIKLYRQANRGAGAARNLGIKAAGGEMVAFLDADDLWHPRKLEIQTAVAGKKKDFGLIATDHTKFNSEKGIFPSGGAVNRARQWERTLKRLDFYALLGRCPFLTSSVLVPKRIFTQTGYFDPELQSRQDRDFWIRISYFFPVYYLPLKLMYYNVRKQSLSNEKKLHGVINYAFIGEKWNPYNPDTPAGKERPVEHRKYIRIFKRIVWQTGIKLWKFSNDADLFERYWQRFSYIFGRKSETVKGRLLLAAKVRYFFRRGIPKKTADKELLDKLKINSAGRLW